MDFEEEEPIYKKVIEEFIRLFQQGEAELVLCYNVYDKEESFLIEKLIDVLDKYSHLNARICIYGIEKEEEEFVIKNVDFFITNRSYQTIHRITLADIYGVTCITGIRKPIFLKNIRCKI